MDSAYYSGAYYLLGYAVECALKACIAKQTNRYDFPDRKLANDGHTHDLERLFRISKLEVEFQKECRANHVLNANWILVKDWSEEYRYIHDVSESVAREFYSAVTSRRNGVLSWLKKWW